MKSRIFALLLCICMIFTFAPTVLADELPEDIFEEPPRTPFEDISGHWAQSYIEEAYEKSLFNGTGDTTFSPNEGMNRGMFVTVLGRLAGVDTAQWSSNYPNFPDVGTSHYYAPYINWAVRNGVAKGVSANKFAPKDLVTREQMATMVANFIQYCGYEVMPPEQEPFSGTFTDQSKIASWAKDAVELLTLTGILNGMPNGDGTYRFSPKTTTTRAQCCTVLVRLSNSLVKSDYLTMPENIELYESEITLYRGESYYLGAYVTPYFATNPIITWSSANPKVVSVTLDGNATWVSAGKTTLTATACNGLTATVSVTAEAPSDLANGNESYYQKCYRIFGQVVDSPRTFYGSQKECEKHIAPVVVKAWDFNSSGGKYTRTFTVYVHENLTATVAQIFREIYNLPSKPPFNYIAGYSYSNSSEHSPGLAIDINPNENYYCSPSGAAIVGSFFDPKRSEYSFPIDGDVQKIFKKYGFTRGIYWNSGYRDYMHFSFFGT